MKKIHPLAKVEGIAPVFESLISNLKPIRQQRIIIFNNKRFHQVDIFRYFSKTPNKKANVSV